MLYRLGQRLNCARAAPRDWTQCIEELLVAAAKAIVVRVPAVVVVALVGGEVPDNAGPPHSARRQ